MNSEINDTFSDEQYRFLYALGEEDLSACDSALQMDGEYHACSANIFYNAKLRTILFKKTSGTVTTNTFMTLFSNYFQATFSRILNILTEVISPRGLTGQREDYEFVKNTHDFNRLYVADNNGRQIFGIIERNYVGNQTGYVSYLNVEYRNFNADICKTVNTTREFSCYPSGGDQYTITQSLSESNEIFASWNYLTAKSRLW